MNTENLDLALQLLLVGMLSVFFILGIVVILGRSLVFIVNKYSPDPKPKAMPVRNNRSSKAISGRKLAVLSAVVDMVTDSKGVLKSVEKL